MLKKDGKGKNRVAKFKNGGGCMERGSLMMRVRPICELWSSRDFEWQN